MRAISDISFELLIGVLENNITLSSKFKLDLRPALFEMIYDPEVRILHARETQQFIWFMIDGLAREVRVEEHSFAERTSWFWLPSSFLYTTPGFFSQKPSKSTIEIIKKSQMVYISYDNWFKLKNQYPEAENITELIRAANHQSRTKHEEQVIHMKTEERYLENQALMDILFSQTKRKFIAEFMGMSIDRLGKLRRKYLR